MLWNEVLLYYFITNEKSIEITSKLLLKVIPKQYFQTYITQWITLLVEINWHNISFENINQLVCYIFKITFEFEMWSFWLSPSHLLHRKACGVETPPAGQAELPGAVLHFPRFLCHVCYCQRDSQEWNFSFFHR